MSPAESVGGAWRVLETALAKAFPELSSEMRPPRPFKSRPGVAGIGQVEALWAITAGQPLDSPGVVGGLQLLGFDESEAERDSWTGMEITGAGPDAVVHPPWDMSTSKHPSAVRAVYFAMGWLPILKEPLEANYLAVDTVPLGDGRPGQIVLCGRDEDEKCVVAPDLATLLRRLAADSTPGNWQLLETPSDKGPFRYVERAKGRLLGACREGELGGGGSA